MASRDIRVLATEIDGVELEDYEEYQLHAEDVDFDNSSNGFTATKSQQAIEEVNAKVTSGNSKAGLVTAGTFTGNPKTATITFSDDYPDTNYVILITGADARSWNYESKTISGFTISTNANQALTGEVSWNTKVTGEL